MMSKHCNVCGSDAHPKLRHPSTFLMESSIWAVAIVIGLFAGTLSAVKSDAGPALGEAIQSVTLSVAQPVEQPEEVAQKETRVPQSTGMQLFTWSTRALVDFLKTAWWVLPIPILFSLWRQFRGYEVCGHCGARELVPVEVQYGDEPPFF